MKLRVTPLSGLYSRILILVSVSQGAEVACRNGSSSTNCSTFSYATMFYTAHNRGCGSMPDWAQREARPEAALCFYPNPLVPILKVMLQVKSKFESRSAWLGRSATSERKRQLMIHRSEDLTEKPLKLWPFLQNACAIVDDRAETSYIQQPKLDSPNRVGANPFWL